LGRQAKVVANDATVIVFKNTGHWLVEGRPQETAKALTEFLTK